VLGEGRDQTRSPFAASFVASARSAGPARARGLEANDRIGSARWDGDLSTTRDRT